MQTEQIKTTMEDRKYLEDEIKLLTMRVNELTDMNLPERIEAAKELRRLRRMR